MYTKGEWKALHYYPHNVYATDGKRPPTTTPIATMTAPDQVEMEANAQLIALSPKMAELLKRMVEGGWSTAIAMEAKEIIQTLDL